MKVLIINGSPRIDGNTTLAVNELVKTFKQEGVDTEVIQVGGKDIRGLPFIIKTFIIISYISK